MLQNSKLQKILFLSVRVIRASLVELHGGIHVGSVYLLNGTKVLL